jgi:sugar/nucleoside kinase (ribokinase family)
MNVGELVDYLVVGHICYDLVPEGRIMGGSAAYAASLAHALGCRTAVLTSAAAADQWQYALPEVAVAQVVSEATTTFENVYQDGARQQTIHAVAGCLGAENVPPAWQRTAIAHLAPIANEVSPDLIDLFSNSLIGLSPQGWMRRWDEDGRVYAVDWVAANRLLPLAAATFISDEDLPVASDVERFAALAPLLVQTAGAEGCTVYCHGERRAFPAPATTSVDPTGAGDCFTAAYLVRLLQTGGDPWESARFANVIAARSVAHRGIPAKMAAVRAQLAIMGTAQTQ